MLVPDRNKEVAFFTAPMHLILSMEAKSCVEDCLVLVCKLILYLCSCKDHPVA